MVCGVSVLLTGGFAQHTSDTSLEGVMAGKRVAVVTGGTGALGRVIVREFVAAGYAAAVPVRAGDQGSSRVLPGATSSDLFTGPAELADEREVKAFVDAVLGRFGRIDALVNAAGGYAGGHQVEEIPLEEWASMMATNLTTCFLMSRAVLGEMRRAGGGRIINIAAMPAVLPSTKRGAYAVSKRGVAALTEVIAEETKGTGITCNAIAPSIILTEANARSMPGADTSKWVKPEEIAKLVLFLCSDEARPISGNVIRVFGGV
jgi:NAD(P)-dependent dehydrogenase (short-subunit alcohol dehydrogenase family)